MKKFMLLALFLAVAANVALAQESASKAAKAPEAMPSADQVLSKYVEALGGKATYEKFKTRTMKGTLEIPAANLSGNVEFQAKAPNMMSMAADLPGFGVVRQGFDGVVAWENNPMQGLREKSGKELADSKLDAEFYRDIKLNELYPKMQVTGREKVGEREAIVIVATPTDGSTEKFYFDAESNLLIRQDSERETPEGKMPIQVYFEDYREVDGIKIPFLMRQVTPMFEMSIKISEVKHNAPVDETLFKKPSGN